MAKGFRIASAYVDIRAEAGGLKQDAESKVRAALASLEGKVKLAVDGKTLRADAEKATKAATTGLRGKVDLDVDAKGLRAEMTAAVKAASAGLEAKIGADFESLSLRRSLQEALSKARTTFDIKVNPNIDRDLYQAQVKKLSETVRVKLNADLDRQGYIAQVMRMSRELEGKFRIAPDINLMALNARVKTAAETVSSTNKITLPVELDERSLTRTHHRMRHFTRMLVSSFAFASPIIAAATEAIELTGAAAAVAVPAFTSLTSMVVAGVVAFEGMGKALQHADSSLGVFNSVIAELAPNGQEFARAFREVNPLMKELQLTVQNVMFEGLADQFERMGNVSLPVFTDGLSLMADLLNDMASGAMDAVTELAEMGTLETMFGALHHAMEPTVDIPGQLLNAIAKLSIAGTPLLRRMTTAFGEWADEMTAKLDKAFASGQLQASISRAGDNIVNFFQRIANNPAWQEFIERIQETGPRMLEIAGNVAEAMLTLSNAAAPVVGVLLEVANAFATIVSALPPELLTTIIGVAVAFKAWSKITAWVEGAAYSVGLFAGNVSRLRNMPTVINPAATSLRNIGTSVAPLAASATAAGVTRTSLAVRSLGLAGIGLGLTALAFKGIDSALDSIFGEDPATDVDRLSNSIARFERTGRLSGEGARVLGKDLGELGNAFRHVIDPSVAERFTHFFDVIDPASNEWDDLRNKIKDTDTALADLVNKGNLKGARFFLKEMAEQSGRSIRELKAELPEYSKALANAKEAQKALADSMGIYGDKALEVSAKLDTQKLAAQGLDQALIALNETHRSAFDAEIAFERGLDDLTAAFKDNGATLDINTRAGQDNASAMSAAAAAHDEMLVSGIAAGETLESMTGKSGRLRGEMVRLARSTGMSETAANEYVNTLLGTPESIETFVRLEKEAAISGLQSVKEKIAATPGAKSITVNTLNAAAIAALEAVGYKTETLPDGRTRVFTANGQSLGAIGNVNSALNSLDGNRADTYVVTHYKSIFTSVYYTAGNPNTLAKAHGRARGGLIRGFAGGGHVAGFPMGGMVSGAGTSTSDSIPAMLSNGEYVIRAAMVEKYGRAFFERLNMGLAKPLGFASGGVARSRIRPIGRVGKSGIQDKDNLKELRSFVTISNESRMAGRWKNELVGAMDSAADLQTLLENFWETQKKITGAFKGQAQKKIMSRFETAERQLIPLQKNLDKVNKSLEKHQDKLEDLQDNFDSLSRSIKDDLIGFGDITKTGKFGTSVNTLIGQLRKDTTRTGAFAGQLDALKAKGLNAKILADIAKAGVTGGGMATATSLLNATPAQIAEINALQAQLTANATRAGKVTADAMYGAGIRAAQGMVAGLKAEKKHIEAVMLDIAQGMERVIKRALGIRSPSRVMEQLGSQTAAGFAIGVAKNNAPQISAREMALSTTGAVSGGVSVSGGSRTIIVHAPVNVDASMDVTDPSARKKFARAFAGDISDAIRDHERARR